MVAACSRRPLSLESVHILQLVLVLVLTGTGTGTTNKKYSNGDQSESERTADTVEHRREQQFRRIIQGSQFAERKPATAHCSTTCCYDNIISDLRPICLASSSLLLDFIPRAHSFPPIFINTGNPPSTRTFEPVNSNQLHGSLSPFLQN